MDCEKAKMTARHGRTRLYGLIQVTACVGNIREQSASKIAAMQQGAAKTTNPATATYHSRWLAPLPAPSHVGVRELTLRVTLVGHCKLHHTTLHYTKITRRPAVIVTNMHKLCEHALHIHAANQSGLASKHV